jgi:hypothetical protein
VGAKWSATSGVVSRRFTSSSLAETVENQYLPTVALSTPRKPEEAPEVGERSIDGRNQSPE